MGQEIQAEEFGFEERQRFSKCLREQLEQLEEVLASPQFGLGPASLGAELEMSLIHPDGRPALLNEALLQALDDPRFTLELNRFNLEYNAPFTSFQGKPFATLAARLEDALGRTRRAAEALQAKVVTIGILPTLVRTDLGGLAMSDTARYRALERELRKQRPGPFHIQIHGDEPLDVSSEHVTFEGANTSLQLHLRVNPDEFARTYNAAQLATAPVLASCVNSPIFLEHCLWEETRVALFKQSVDHRARTPGGSAQRARVAFGNGWIQHPVQLFQESVDLYEPLLPVFTEPRQVVAGLPPTLTELRLHHGTVWPWNRAIYDPALGGHLRIEFRVLPAGPSLEDMTANAAFLIGLTLGLADDIRRFEQNLSFDLVHENFYRAAQHGPHAVLTWLEHGRMFRSKAADLIEPLLETAAQGLLRAGIAADEVRARLGIIQERIACGQTGAAWQRQALSSLERAGHNRASALKSMLKGYMEFSEANLPVHTWQPLGRAPAGEAHDPPH